MPSAPRPTASPSWQTSVALVAISQFLGTATTSMVYPFLPRLVRDLGVDASQEALYAGLGIAVGGIPMLFTGPLWGYLADRYGRKPMLLRASIATGISFFGFALAPNIATLLLTRFFQGSLAAANMAAMAFITSVSPREKVARSLGMSMGLISMGSTLGPGLGGLLADAVGFRDAFIASAGIVLLSSVVLWRFVHEDFERPAMPPFSLGSVYGETWRVVGSRSMLPVLGIVVVAQGMPFMFFTLMPRFLEGLTGHEASAASIGLVFSISGVASGLSAPFLGWWAARVRLRTMLAVCCLVAAVLYLPIALVQGIGPFYGLWTLLGVAQSGAMLAMMALISIAAARSAQGKAFGAFQSSIAVAITGGPLLGGAVASAVGPRYAFGVASGVFLTLTVATLLLVPKVLERVPVSPRQPQPATAESPAPAARAQ